jgi:lysophospholipase L1-like esterase
MKYINKFENFLLEKVNAEKYLPRLGKVENNRHPAEIKAFLDVIAFAEGTYKSPDNGYKTQFTGKQFDSYDDHPREVISASGLDSTAAGRYQFLSSTWDGIMKGKKFDPKAEIPENIGNDTDITELSAKEKSRVGRRRRSGSSYSGGDSLPFTVGMSSGKNVKLLQKALINLGASLPVYGIDGLFGSETMGTSKAVLTNIYDYINKDIKGEIINELSKDNYELIINSSNETKATEYVNSKMKDEKYTDYSENIPMVDGEIADSDNIHNYKSISKFLTKMKNGEAVKIYHIGDSHIQAPWLADTIKNGLSSSVEVTYDKNATNGWTVAKHLKNIGTIKNDLSDGGYDLVIISLGGNDSYMSPNKFNSNRFESRYTRLVESIKEFDSNVEVLLTTPTSSVFPIKTKNVNPNKTGTQSSIYNVANKEDVAVWDIFNKMGGVNSILKWYEEGLVSDGVHLNKRGYNRIGQMLVSDLKKYYSKNG